MSRRLLILIIPLVAGILIGSFVPEVSNRVRAALGFSPGSTTVQSAGHDWPQEADTHGEASDQKQAKLALTSEQIAAARIDVMAVHGGMLARRIIVPGSIIPNADRIARVSVKLTGTVAELYKKPGDQVAKGELLAVFESRELADAKSELLAARLTDELQQDLYQRDAALWEKRISNEQQFLKSRNAAAQTRMRLDIARQKLLALGLSEAEIQGLPNQPEATLRRQEIRSPIAGRVAERKVDLGTAMGRDNLETELFVIVDLTTVWVELAVSPADLPAIKQGQPVSITARGTPGTAEGKIVFLSPLLEKETRSARVVAEITNNEGVWWPGSFVTAAIATGARKVPAVVPVSALQTINGEQVVFVRAADGFEKRKIVLGSQDARVAEVRTGLKPGEFVAISNTFALKAGSLKALAED